MNCGGDPYVIEYNVRMGDPETEAVMTRIDSDLLHHLSACARGCLKEERISISPSSALTVVCVSGGYPGSYPKGKRISGGRVHSCGSFTSPVKVFHSGTSLAEDGSIVTSGGRVLAITSNSFPPAGEGEAGSWKKSIVQGRETCYAELENIDFDGKYFRRDIGLDIIRYIEG